MIPLYSIVIMNINNLHPNYCFDKMKGKKKSDQKA